MVRQLIVPLLAVVAAVSASCGSVESRSRHTPAREVEARTISGYGMAIDLPDRWRGRIFKRDAKTAVLLRAANVPLYLGSSLSLGAAGAGMPADGVFVEVADLDVPHARELAREPHEGWVTTSLPVEIRRSDFGRFEGVAAPGFALRNVVVSGRAIMVGVGFGTREPSDRLLARANEVLATLRISSDPTAWGGDHAADPVPRVAFNPPGGWFTAETSSDESRPVPVAWAGNVPFVDDPAEGPFPDATVRTLPAGGIVLQAAGPRLYTSGESFPWVAFPLRLSDGRFHATAYKGQPASNVSVYSLDTWVDGGLLNVTIWLGSTEPTRGMIAAANDALATLFVDR